MLCWLAMTGLGLGASLEQEAADTGGLARRLAPPDQAELVLLYAGEQGGELGPCGCSPGGLGGLPRTGQVVEALHQRGDPVLALNAGGWLTDARTPDGDFLPHHGARNLLTVAIFDGMGWDAVNLGRRDLPWLMQQEELPEWLVSANLRRTDGGPMPAPLLLREVQGRRVAITGVSGSPRFPPAGAHFDPPALAVAELLADVEADLVVLLAVDVGRDLQELAAVEGVDVIVQAERYAARWGPEPLGETLWVRSHDRTEWLGELRLQLEDREIVAAVDRKIKLDDRLRGERSLRRRVRRAERRIEAIHAAMYPR